MARKRLDLVPGEKLAHGVDAGCGTGQSSVALLHLCRKVTGVDNSRSMLANALTEPGVSYLLGTAESLPLPDDSADIFTTSLSIHWFDLPLFLSETARVLRPGGWLISYSNGFKSQMIGTPEFSEWSRLEYATRYPSPPRQPQDPTRESFSGSRFELVDGVAYKDRMRFTRDELAAYLMTQSNVIARLEQGDELAGDVLAWLVEELSGFFSGDSAEFVFGGNVTYARLME